MTTEEVRMYGIVNDIGDVELVTDGHLRKLLHEVGVLDPVRAKALEQAVELHKGKEYANHQTIRDDAYHFEHFLRTGKRYSD